MDEKASVVIPYDWTEGFIDEAFSNGQKMRTLLRFLKSPSSEKWLQINVLFTLGIIKLGLLLLPFRRLYNVVARFSHYKIDRDTREKIPLENIINVIDRASRRFLGANSCFPQALTGKVLLERHGYPVQVRLGVKQAEKSKLIAHAWLEKDGEVIIGGPKSLIESYTPLTDLEKVLF